MRQGDDLRAAYVSIPLRPSGGDLFVLSTKNPLKIDDWKADGHT